MNARTPKPAQRARRREAATLGNGAIAETRRNPAAAQLAAAELEARTVDHQVKVALAAYFIAEKRGFEPGHELDDWLAAEAQVATAEQPSIVKSIEPSKAENVS